MAAERQSFQYHSDTISWLSGFLHSRNSILTQQPNQQKRGIHILYVYQHTTACGCFITILKFIFKTSFAEITAGKRIPCGQQKIARILFLSNQPLLDITQWLLMFCVQLKGINPILLLFQGTGKRIERGHHGS